MHLSEIMSVEKLERYVEDKLVSKRKHPTLPIYILNYTAKTQFEWNFDEVTLNTRGLVIDENYNIVARSLPKFFSYEQLDGKLPEGNFIVEEKLDGSMLLVFNYNGEVITATRGSFESDQAKKAYEYLTPSKLAYVDEDGDAKLFRFDSDLTYVFEVIYKDNHIVVDYDYEGLVLLTMVDKTGMEYDSAFMPFRRPKVYSFESLEEILNHKEDNIEGFVLRYSDGQRVKIKLEEYKRLHRLITGLNERDIWEALKEGTFDKMLEEIPDEMYDFVHSTKEALETKFAEIRTEAMSNMKDLGSRKENALYYQTQKYPSVMFFLLDGKPIDELIWEMVRPKVTQTYKVVSEDNN